MTLLTLEMFGGVSNQALAKEVRDAGGRCAVCEQAICDHSDLEFAGIVPPPETPGRTAA